MIGRLNHVAIAVPDLEAAARQYRDVLGASVSPVEDQPEHGVQTVFVELPNTKVELLGVLGEGSPIQGFLDRNPAGGIHHLCFILAISAYWGWNGGKVDGPRYLVPIVPFLAFPLVFYLDSWRRNAVAVAIFTIAAILSLFVTWGVAWFLSSGYVEFHPPRGPG